MNCRAMQRFPGSLNSGLSNTRTGSCEPVCFEFSGSGPAGRPFRSEFRRPSYKLSVPTIWALLRWLWSAYFDGGEFG